MAALTGNTVASTYKSLIKLVDNGTVSSSLKNLTDGLGNPTALWVGDDEALISGSLGVDGGVNITGSLVVNGIEIVSGSTVEAPFLYNQTNGTDYIRSHQNIFNHGDLFVRPTDTFVIEAAAEYYILGDLTNSGSLIVSGTLIADGAILNYGPIILASGSGQIL